MVIMYHTVFLVGKMILRCMQDKSSIRIEMIGCIKMIDSSVRII